MYSEKLESDQLKPCPWCGKKPVFICTHDKKTGRQYEHMVWCIYEYCRARPHICVDKNYTREQVQRIWNRYAVELPKPKEPVKNLRNFRNYLSKNELRGILIDANCSEDVWGKYLPEFPYMTQAEEKSP